MLAASERVVVIAPTRGCPTVRVLRLSPRRFDQCTCSPDKRLPDCEGIETGVVVFSRSACHIRQEAARL